jgi:hypothetical protein
MSVRVPPSDMLERADKNHNVIRKRDGKNETAQISVICPQRPLVRGRLYKGGYHPQASHYGAALLLNIANNNHLSCTI